MDKTHDLILNMVGNPTFTFNNLKTVGLTSDNTELLSEDRYLSSPKIQNNPMFLNDEGSFDKNKFHTFYEQAKLGYNFMATEDYNKLAPERSFHRNNIWAPKEQRRKGPEFEWVRGDSNPDKSILSLVRLGKKTEGKLTVDELAQREQVLANPIEATNPDGTIDESKAIWHAAPEDSFWTDFTSTRVLAQWDEEGDHKDPISGRTVHHSKGDPKLNSNGNYYYENLEGRDVYGRRVLNKMNVLTKEGSELNKYDFFDSDDKEQKSFGGSIMKQAALVGSMFIPYVGPWIAGLSVFNQSVGLLGTLGKMATGFSNEVFNTNINDALFSNMEGWSKSVSRQTSTQYAQEHPWSIENMVGMVGDVLGQFKEQRVLFENAPIIFKNKYGFVTPENYNQKLLDIEKTYAKVNQTKIEELLQAGKANSEELKSLVELQRINGFRASAELDSYIKGYNKIGEAMSKAYMTGITVADTYGEALQQGASKQEAMWLTLGYGAGEAAILNTGVGEWLFPELRYEKLHLQAVLKGVGLAKGETKKLEEKLVNKSLNALGAEAKTEHAKNIFNIGWQTAKDLYTGNKFLGDKTIKAAFFNALGEGIEEDTEELLSDLSKQAFNWVGYLRGDDTRMDAFDNGDWSKIFDRYALNALGGFVGGGIAGFNLDNIRQMKKLDNMEFNPSMQELIYYVRNGKTDELLSNLNKIELGNKNLSATKYTQAADGSILWAQGTVDDNQDLAAKNAVRQQIKLIGDILDAHGIRMSDSSFLSKQTDILKDIKFSYLQKSATAGRFLQEFNTLSDKIVQLNSLLEGQESASGDSENSSADTVTSDNLKAQKKIELRDLIKQRDDLVNSKRAGEFVGDALFELTDAINGGISIPSFLRYAEASEHKPFNQISDERKSRLYEEWNKIPSSEKADKVHAAASALRGVMGLFGPHLMAVAQRYDELVGSDIAKNLQYLEERHFQQLNAFAQDPRITTEAWLQAATHQVDSQGAQLINAFEDDDFKLKLQGHDQRIQEENQNYIQAQQAINDDTTLTAEEKTARLKEAEENHKAEIEAIYDEKGMDIQDKLMKDAIKLVDPYLQEGFANSEVKRELAKILRGTIDGINERVVPLKRRLHELQTNPNGSVKKEEDLSDADKAEIERINDALNPLTQQSGELLSKLAELKALSATPIEKILDKFAISNNSDVKVSEVLKLANDILDGVDDLGDFSVSKDVADQIGEALQLIDLFNSVIEASKVDEGNLDNVFGYNKVVNEVNHKVGTENYIDLPEISSKLGDVLQQDLMITRNKLLFIRNLYAANQGLKLSEQTRTSLNKDYLFYKKLKDFSVSIGDDDDDWKGIDILRNKLANLATLEANYLQRKTSLDSETKAKIDKEVIEMSDAIYEFFLTNKDTLKQASKLADLLKRSGLNLFEVPHGTLNSATNFGPKSGANEQYNPNYLDDNAFIWWVATRASVKASDFYAEYALVIDNEMAPIPTQELATYENYASVVNGDIFTQFFNGYRKAVQDLWLTMPVESELATDGTVIKKGRKQIIKEQNEFFSEDFKFSTENMGEDAYKEFPFINLIVPKYSHIVFTEGIPGSGKTTGVYKSTVKMLLKFHPNDHILDRVIVVHGASKQSAEDLVFNREDNTKPGSLGLDPSKTTAMSLDEFMDYISTNRVNVTLNNDGTITVPGEKYGMSRYNEIKSKTTIKELSDAPTLIIIDELTHANQFDLDDIENFASKYGITILGAGDTDQSGFHGDFKIEGTNTALDGSYLPLGVYNVNFVRTPKLGVSMRTNNSQKTRNLPAAQTWVNDLSLDLTLHYYQDENGIFGDKVYNDEDKFDELKEDIDLMISTLKDGEKIGFIYDDENSLLAQLLLTDDSYKDKIEPLPGTSAQGKEGLYYIIQMTNQGGNFAKDMYTAITRSSQGSLILTDADSGVDNLRNELGDPIADSETHIEELGRQSIASYSQKRKETLTAITQGTGNPVEYVPRKKAGQRQRTQQLNQQQLNQQLQQGLGQGTPLPLPQPLPTTPLPTPQPAPQPAPLPTPQPAPVTPQPVTATDAEVQLVKDQMDAAGMGIGSKVEWTDGQVRTVLDVHPSVNTKYVYVQLQKDDEEPYDVLAETFLAGGYKPHQEVLEINEITNSKGITIKVNDIVVIPEEDPEVGFESGHYWSQVDKIDSDGTIYYYNEDNDTYEKVGNIEDVLFASDDEDEIIAYAESDESKQYYQTALPLSEPPVETLGTDLANPDTYQEQIVISNQALGGSQTPLPNETPEKCNIYAYSYNTFESGVGQDADGNVIQFGDDNQKSTRLDSINGLLNLDKQLGNQPRKYSDYMKIIGRLRAAIMNISDKSQLNHKIEEILHEYFGISGISSNFGLVSHAEVNPATGFSRSSGKYTRLQRSGQETLDFIHTQGDKSFGPARKTISCEIALNGTDILELPILTLSSPLTMMAQGMVPDEVMQIAQTIDNEGLERIIANEDLLSKYKGFVTLVKTYRRITGDAYFSIKDPNWTPCANLKNKGINIIGDSRGYNYAEPGYEYDAGFIDILELAKNPSINISELLYSQVSSIPNKSQSAFLNIGGTEDIIQAGHPFVLVSTDPNLRTTQDLSQAFVDDLQENGECSRVKLVYVLPPKVDIDTYIKSMAKLMIGKKNEIDDIGNSTTAFKLLTLIFSDPNSSQIVVNKSKKWLPFIQKMIEDTKDMTGAEVQEYLSQTDTVDANKNVKRSTLAKRLLASLVYPDINNGDPDIDQLKPRGKKNLDLIKLILNANGVDGIFFRANKSATEIAYGPESFLMFKLSQNNDWTITDINGNRHSYQIHGHVDSNIFEGDLTEILDNILLNTTPDRSNSATLENKADKQAYINRCSVSGLRDPDAKIKSDLESVRQKTGINIDLTTLTGNYEDKLRQIAHILTSNYYPAVIINHKLKIFSKSDGIEKFIGMNDEQEINRLRLDNNGEAHFRIKMGDGVIRECIYHNDSIEILIPQEGKVAVVNLTHLSNILDTINNSSSVPRVLNRLKVLSGSEFITALLSLSLNPDLLKRALSQVFDDELIIQEILDAKESQPSTNNCEAKSIILNLI